MAEALAVGKVSQIWRPKTGLKSKTETGITGHTTEPQFEIDS
jgi:hypothetical protein